MYSALSFPTEQRYSRRQKRFYVVNILYMIKTRIKELREEKGLSQTKLAAELGLNQRTVSNYETGSLEPNIQTIKKLCEYFGVSADYLLGLEEF